MGNKKEAQVVGRDEMNLAEFPITLLTDQNSKTLRTLTFEDPTGGKLTITGSDDLGLPTAPDADVLIALISLTKQRNNFTESTVQFSRYEVLRILGWDDHSRSYRRLDESIRRWVGVTLRFDKCWYDNAIKCRVDASFHILDRAVVYDQEVRKTLRERQQPLPLCSFTWGQDFFASCQSDNIKRLDLETYFNLRSSVSKRLYRFLDKRFYVRKDWVFELRELALEHIGLSRAYSAAKIKEKIKPALEELESIGFLMPLPPAERYRNEKRGVWKIRLTRNLQKAIGTGPELSTETDLEDELVRRGVSPAMARDLAETFSKEHINKHIEQLDWLQAKKTGKVKDIPGFLVQSIRDDFAPPSGFESIAVRMEREAVRQNLEAEQSRRHQQIVKERARGYNIDRRIREYWESLTPEEQSRVEIESLEGADETTRELLKDAVPSIKRGLTRTLREAYLRRLLGFNNQD